MVRPRNNQYRTAILGALKDKHLCSIKDFNNHLRSTGHYVSEASTRRFVNSMVKEGLLSVWPETVQTNEKHYTYGQGAINHTVAMLNYDNELITLGEFLGHLPVAKFPYWMNDKISVAIKQAMLDYIVSARPDLYREEKKDVPDSDAIKHNLEALLKEIQELHRFIKNFLDTRIHTAGQRKLLAKELDNCPTTHVITKEWQRIEDDE